MSKEVCPFEIKWGKGDGMRGIVHTEGGVLFALLEVVRRLIHHRSPFSYGAPQKPQNPSWRKDS